MRIGTAYSNIENSFLSGKNAIEKAIKSNNIENPSLVIAFCNIDVNHKEFFKGIKSIVGEISVVGGSGVGIITNEVISYKEFSAGVVVIEDPDLDIQIAHVEGLDKDEKAAGKKLVELLPDDLMAKMLLLFYDSIKQTASETTPMIMNASRPLIEGITENLKNNLLVVGEGTLADHAFHKTEQFCGSTVKEQSVVGIALDGPFDIYTRTTHGTTLLDGIYHTVTKTDGPVILEIDGRPAIDVVNEIQGGEDWQTEIPLRRLNIGINYGGKFDDYNEENYVSRLIVCPTPDKSGIVMFEPDITPGTEFQFMLRDSQAMITSAKENTEELFAQIEKEGKKAEFVFYINCAGRAAVVSLTDTEEAAELQKICNEKGIPLFGSYSGVEIAPFYGVSKGLDWTGVIVVFATNKD